MLTHGRASKADERQAFEAYAARLAAAFVKSAPSWRSHSGYQRLWINPRHCGVTVRVKDPSGSKVHRVKALQFSLFNLAVEDPFQKQYWRARCKHDYNCVRMTMHRGGQEPKPLQGAWIRVKPDEIPALKAGWPAFRAQVDRFCRRR